jgi:hypothetical protein
MAQYDQMITTFTALQRRDHDIAQTREALDSALIALRSTPGHHRSAWGPVTSADAESFQFVLLTGESRLPLTPYVHTYFVCCKAHNLWFLVAMSNT